MFAPLDLFSENILYTQCMNFVESDDECLRVIVQYTGKENVRSTLFPMTKSVLQVL